MSTDYENEHGVAHHGPPILTRRDEALCNAMAAWIAIARERNGKDWLPGGADICKSRLFWRLRAGKKPLPSPPPTAYSCPWYELIDEPERPHWAYDMGEWNGETFFAQCRYEVLARNDDGKPARVKFGPYEFRCWRGASPYGNGVEGWWLQHEPANARLTGPQREAHRSDDEQGN